jgi:hypothetical protein
VTNPGDKLDEALLELRVRVLFRVAQILNIRATVGEVRELVGHKSDQEILEHLTIRESYQPPGCKDHSLVAGRPETRPEWILK